MDITVHNPLPAEIVALSIEVVERRDLLAEKAHHLVTVGIAPGDEDAAREANALYKQIHEFSKDLKAQKAVIKRPVLELADQIETVAREAAEILERAKATLGETIAKWQGEEVRRREEERAKAQAEADRIAREAQAKLEAEARERAELEALPGEEPAEPEFGEVPVVHAARVYVPPPPKSAVSMRTVKTLHIDNERLIPFEMNGLRLWKEPDRKAIQIALENGQEVPGCRLVTEQKVVAKGR
jgi:hypothetical protein